jgi:transcriptional regulator with XRE-family HTH domain
MASGQPNSKRHPVDVHVGRRIRQRRLELALTQAAVAVRIGVTLKQLQKYESATNRIAASRLYELSRALGVEVGFFFADMPNHRRRNHTKGK